MLKRASQRLNVKVRDLAERIAEQPNQSQQDGPQGTLTVP